MATSIVAKKEYKSSPDASLPPVHDLRAAINVYGASGALTRAKRTPGAVAVSGIYGEGPGEVESSPVSPQQTQGRCGVWAVLSECSSGLHHFAKRIVCGKEWCPECGQDDSAAHKRKQSRLIPKIQQVKELGYFVIEFPRIYRHIGQAGIDPDPKDARGWCYSKADLRATTTAIVNVMAGKRMGRRGRVGGFFSRGLVRWHWFGDKAEGKWNPHANVLVDSGYLEPELLEAIKAASEEAEVEIHCACPDVILCHTLGQIFNKLTPILEAGEENGLPPGHGLCSLQQIRVGGMAKGIIPVPDLVTGSSYYCDMGSKADELLHERYGHPAIYVDGSMDSRWGEYPDYLSQRVEFLGAQLNKLFDKVKEVIGIEVTRGAWDKAMATSRELYGALGRLTRLMTADPMPISGVEVGLALQLTAGSTGRVMTEGPEAVSILCEEVEKRVKEGIGVVEKGAPRVLNFIQPFSDPSLIHMMENAGLAMSATLLSVPPKKYPPTTYTTLGEIRAEREMKDGHYHSAFGFAKRFEEAVKDLNIDGVLWGYLYNCRPLAQTSHLVKKWVEETTGVPTLALEMDIYDSRNYSAAALRTRVEAFAEMLRARKASARV